MNHQYLKKSQNLIISTINLCKNFNPSLTLKQQIDHSHELLNHLDLPFNTTIRTKQIGCRRVISYSQLRITIYLLPSNKIMKLHNHPNMYVLTYILQGSMDALFFNPSPHYPELYTKEFAVLSKGMKAYTQPKLNNLHEFKGNDEGCAFLDIIFPDYNETDRPCSYFNYKQGQKIQENQMYQLDKLPNDYFQYMVEV